MDRNEIILEMQLPYDDLLKYLLKKYGGALCDYFHTPECKTKNKKVTRTGEGLYCHHMDEDKGGNLGESAVAIRQPFEWQKKERLVYCNILEHLILHQKIALLRQRHLLETPKDVFGLFTTGGIYMICREINDMFMNNGTSVAWKKRCYQEIENNYNDYICLIKSFMRYIEENYIGCKDVPAFLVPGTVIHLDDGDYCILQLSKIRDQFRAKNPKGEIKAYLTRTLESKYQYVDAVDIVYRRLSVGYELFYDSIYHELIEKREDESIKAITKLFSIDYHGYGFVQFSSIMLGPDYGSKNADEYISKALPMYSESNYDLRGKHPVFWKGSKIPRELENNFFIIRIKTMFTIKKNQTPFVRYREDDWFHMRPIGLTDNHNFLDRGWIVLETSDYYSNKDGKRHSRFIDFDGKKKDITVTLSLGKEDFELFIERYSINYIEVLDGCYFVETQ